MKNKKLFIILGIILGIIVLFVVTYLILLSPVGRSNKEVTFIVEKGDGKEKIINNLKDAKLIRSKYATILYVILSGSKNLQAGSYNFSRDMSTSDIIKSLKTGDVIKKYKDSSRITLKEYLKLICDETNLNYEKSIKDVNDKAFLKGLIADYWFLTDDILDDDIYFLKLMIFIKTQQ